MPAGERSSSFFVYRRGEFSDMDRFKLNALYDCIISGVGCYQVPVTVEDVWSYAYREVHNVRGAPN